MKKLVFGLLILLSTVSGVGPKNFSHCMMNQPLHAQEGTQQPPHRPKPDSDQFCRPLGTPDRPRSEICECHRKCVDNTDEEGNPDGTFREQEDPRCTMYCWKDNCTCAKACP